MSIEFSCPSCGKVLKTSDDRAGMNAKCPDCGGMVVVPGAAAGEPPRDVDEAHTTWGAREMDTGARDDADLGAAMKPCPMCGREIRESARVCRFCGERFDSGQPGVPTVVQPGEVINASWSLFKVRGAAVVGGFLAAMGIQVLLILAFYAVAFAVLLSSGFPDRPPSQEAIIALVVIAIPAVVVMFIIQVYLNLGQAIFQLNIVKGREPNFRDIFSGGPYLLAGLGGGAVMFVCWLFLYTICYGPMFAVMAMNDPGDPLVGLINLVGSGVYYLGWGFLMMRTMPYVYYIVDQRMGGLASLGAAWSLTGTNMLSQFVVVPVMFVALYIVGALACCVGIFVTFPLFFLMQAVAYQMMLGRTVTVPET